MPHNLLFLIYNFVYIAPVVYVYFFGFSAGGADQAIKLSTDTTGDMLFFYSIAVVSFYLGSFFVSSFVKVKNETSIFCVDSLKYKITKSQGFVFFLLCSLFVFVKLF